MSWTLLLLLACPLMMVFCMKGMFSGNKDKKTKDKDQQPQASEGLKSEGLQPDQDVQSLQIQMADLIEQNEELKKEVQSMKESRSTNVVDLKEGQEKRNKAEIS